MADDNLVTCFYLLRTFKAFLQQSEPQADNISLLQPRKILTMHICDIWPDSECSHTVHFLDCSDLN